MSDSVRPHRQQPTRLPRPWDSPGKNTGVGCHFLLQCMQVKSESEVAQSCPTLSDPMDCSLPGSSIHGIFQARVLEYGAISFSRGSSQPRDQTRVSHTAGRCFTMWITTNCGKFLKRWEYQTTLPASWETYMQVKKQHWMESNMETYITICKIDSQREFAVWLRELKLGLCNNLEEWDGEGGDVCIPMVD